jgi:hypothetical protein
LVMCRLRHLRMVSNIATYESEGGPAGPGDYPTGAVAAAGMSGMRYLRKLVPGRGFGVVQLDSSQYADVAEPMGSDYTEVVHLDRSEYTEVR